MSLNRNSVSHGAPIHRRELLQIGFSGYLGLGLTHLLQQAALAKSSTTAAKGTHGRAKSVIFVFQTGAPAHQDIWDLKPEAPAEVRGDYLPVDTNVPGIQVGPHIPRLAKLVDKLAIVRSMSHSLPSHEHGTHWMLTGINDNPIGATHMASRNDWPCYASGVQYLQPRSDGLPTGVMLPTYLQNGYGFCGQNGGILGGDFDPWHVTKDPNTADFKIDELNLFPGLTVERFQGRETLLANIDSQRRDLDKAASVRDMSTRMQQATSILTSAGKFREAFDIDRESKETRDRYGRHAFGQSLLLARRLVEAGVPVIQANMGTMNNWDTHGQNFTQLKDRLLPPFDQGLATLIMDLEERGLLDQTLIVATGEFGRTPKINENAGRDHWSAVFSAVFAGGGVRGGQVIGASDATAAYPATRAYFPADLGATIYSTLGIEPESLVYDRLKRPHGLNKGNVIEPLYS
jgi:hypothetical protein